MPKRKKIVVVYDEASLDISSELEMAFSGGAEPEPSQKMEDTSLMTVIEQVDTIVEVLTDAGYEVSTALTSPAIGKLIEKLREEKPDMVLNFCESIEGDSFQEMNMAGLYELLGIPYTGSGPLTLGSCLNKARTKEILSFHKLNVPSFAVFTSPEEVSGRKINFPVIVKPVHEDASSGISNGSVVSDREHLRLVMDDMIKKYKQPVLVEQYVEGREFNVAVVGNEEPIALPVSEIDFSTMPEGYHHIVSYEAKWMPETVEYKSTIPVCPAKISQRLQQKLQNTAVKAYQLMKCRDYARVDMRVDKTGRVFILEVNPNPDLSLDGSGFARSAEAFGWSYGQLIVNIVESAFKRSVGTY